MRLIRLKLFAAKDYYHLSQAEAEALNKQRNELAKKLMEKRKQILADKASFDAAAMGDKTVLRANENALSSNYKTVMKETKDAAEKLRVNALDNSTNTKIGKETNSFAKMNLGKDTPKPSPQPKPSQPKPNPQPKPGGNINANTVKTPKPTVAKGNPVTLSRNMKVGIGLAGATALGIGAAQMFKNKKKDDNI